MKPRTKCIIVLGISSFTIIAAVIGICKYIEFREKNETAVEQKSNEAQKSCKEKKLTEKTKPDEKNKLVEEMKSGKENKSVIENQTTEPPPGITNSDNICYFNSVLQCIYNLKSFREAMLTTNYSGYIFTQLKKIFNEMSKKGDFAINTKQLIENISKNKPSLNSSQQQDAYEFLLTLIEMIVEETKDQHINSLTKEDYNAINKYPESHHEPLKRLKEEFLQKYFYNIIQEEILSHGCNHCDESIKIYFGFSFKISGTIQEMINKITVATQTKCRRCNSKNESVNASIKKTALYKSQYQVFLLDRKIGKTEKNNSTVVINTNIDFFDDKYELNSFIEHYGDNKGGLYFCYVKKQNDWYKCDDQNVTYIKNSEMENILNGNTCVYMVFYEKIKNA